MSLQYDFDLQGNSPRDGFNDPLKTMFFTAAEIVIREAFQNSLDAHSSDKPVHIQVDLLTEKTSAIPEVESLKKIFRACAKDKAGKKVYENALKILKGDEIHILRISDSNTTGLSGDNEDEEGRYYNFFKAVGGHYGTGSGGSYGYGKTTNIAFSAISTFFATSKYQGKSNIENVFMGGLRVVTHERDGKKYRGIGSFGKPGQCPVRLEDEIPEIFRREKNEPGTDIFIPAFKGHDDWQRMSIKSALKNFWLAILEKRLVVHVAGEEISSKNIVECMAKYFPQDTKIKSWKKEDPTPYIKAYLEGEQIDATLPTLGKVNIYILPGNSNDSTGHVACFRKRLMLIQHKEFESIIPYTGVFVCADEDGNEVLQKMELPQHNSWTLDADHARDENGVVLPECSAADKEYKKYIRENLEQLVGKKTREKVFLSSIDDFIALKGQAEEDHQEPADQQGSSPKNGVELVRRRSSNIEIVERPLGRVENFGVDDERPNKKCALCDQKPCICPCSECHQYPCICLCSKCGKKPCVCPCNKCNKYPCTCPKEDRPGGEIKGSIRSIAELIDKEWRTTIIIRTKPPLANQKIKIRLRAGTDEKFEVVDIKSVTPPAINTPSGIISGIVTDDKGVANVVIQFDKNQKYALGASIYED